MNTHCFTSKIYFYLVLNKTHVVFITLINLTASSYLHFLILHEFSSRLRTNLLHRHLSFRDLFHKVVVRLLFSVAPRSGEQYIDNSHEDIVDIHFWMEFLGDERHLGDWIKNSLKISYKYDRSLRFKFKGEYLISKTLSLNLRCFWNM